MSVQVYPPPITSEHLVDDIQFEILVVADSDILVSNNKHNTEQIHCLGGPSESLLSIF